MGVWRHGAGGHGAAGTHEDPRLARGRAARLGAIWRDGPGRHLSAAVGALLRRAFARRGVRLASGRGRQIHACGQLDRARAAWRGQQRAALPHHLGHGTRAHAPHDRRDAPGRHGRAAHRAAPPPRQCAGFAARPHVRRAGGERGHRCRGAADGCCGGAGHGRHQRRPRANPRQLAHQPPPARHPAQWRTPLCRRSDAPPRRRSLGRADHPRRRDVELRSRFSAPFSAFRGAWPVHHSVQIGAVAQPPGRTHRTGTAGHRFRHPLAVPASGRAREALDLAPAELAHRGQGVRHLGRRAQPAHPRHAVPRFPQRDVAGQPPAGEADGRREQTLFGGRHAGGAGREDERAGWHQRRAARRAAGHGRHL